MVGTADDRLLCLEYYQDGLRVVNGQCKMESISFAIPSSYSPPDYPLSPPRNTQSSSPPKGPWSFTTATRTGKVRLKVPSSQVWVAEFSACLQGACLGALRGEHSLKVAHSPMAFISPCGETTQWVLGSDRGDARCRTRSTHELASLGIGSGLPKGLTLIEACHRLFALLCVPTAETWWNNCYGMKK